MTAYLTLDRVLEIHGEVIRLHGGDPAIHDIRLLIRRSPSHR